MISFMGYNDEQLQKIISFWEDHNRAPEPSTKSELNKELQMLLNGISEYHAGQWIKFFIKAGMLKVKEEEKITQRNLYFNVTSIDGKQFTVNINDLVNVLKLAGFEIKSNAVWGNAEIKVKQEEPICEIKGNYGSSLHIKIWADGRVDGIDGIIINRIPQYLAKNNS